MSGEDVPAVTEPFASNAGFNVGEVFGGGVGTRTAVDGHFALAVLIGTISSLNLPAACAAAVRCCERTANSSCSLRLKSATCWRRFRRSRPCPYRRRAFSHKAPGCGSGLKPIIGTRVMLSTPRAHEHVAGAHRDRAGGDMDRRHRRAAKAVDGGAADRFRQSRHQADEAGDVKALLALGEGAAHEHILDVLGVDAGPGDEAGDHLRGEVVRPDRNEFALFRQGERRARIARNDGAKS